MPITLTLAGYCAAWVILIRAARKHSRKPPAIFLVLIATAVLIHCWGLYTQILVPGGYQFSFVKIASLFFLVANLLILAATLRNPLHNLFLVTIPLTAIALLTSLYSTNNMATPPSKLTTGIVGHILLSIVAYSTMIVATAQALALAFQNHQIRNKHPGGLARLLPPLQTMEALLFELLWVGQILLTAVMITGISQIQSLSAQHLPHKIVFTACSWITYAILLWGRHARGWRGNSAIRWTLAGFAFLILAYFGTKFVLELIMGVNTANY